MDQKTADVAIYVSAVMVAVGCFLPLTTLRIFGAVSYYRIASTESFFVVGFALAAPLLVLFNQRVFTALSPMAIWITLFNSAIRNSIFGEDASLITRAARSATAPLDKLAADLFMNVADFSWGGLVFLIGLLLLTAATMLAFIRSE